MNRTTLLEKLKRKRAQGSPLAVLLGGPLPVTADDVEMDLIVTEGETFRGLARTPERPPT